MAKFVNIGDGQIINLDQIAFAHTNFDQRGGLLIQLTSSGRISDRDRGSLSLPQMLIASRTTLIFPGGAQASLLSAAILSHCEDLAAYAPKPRKSA